MFGCLAPELQVPMYAYLGYIMVHAGSYRILYWWLDTNVVSVPRQSNGPHGPYARTHGPWAIYQNPWFEAVPVYCMLLPCPGGMSTTSTNCWPMLGRYSTILTLHMQWTRRLKSCEFTTQAGSRTGIHMQVYTLIVLYQYPLPIAHKGTSIVAVATCRSQHVVRVPYLNVSRSCYI